jgi:hypothetical protein
MQTQIQATIDFSKDGNSRDVTIAGWSIQEPSHVWSIGSHSTICLDTPVAPFGFFIEIDWQPAVRPPFITQQMVIIEVNGRMVKACSLGRPGIYAYYCQPLDTQERRMMITFHHPNAFAASEFDHAREKRKLALRFRRLRILTLAEPWRIANGASSAMRIKSMDNARMIAEAERATGVALNDLLHGFEMLAGNCDMGLALRSLGFEKISLLRFAGATPAVAIKGLETNFDGIGQKISLSVADNPMKEWMVSDAFGLRFHSGQSSEQVEHDVLMKKFRPYAELLRRKFLEDVVSGEKVFVYADHKEHSVTRGIEEVLPLFLALRRRTTANLLWVCPAANDPAQRGVVTEILPGLAQAQLDMFAPPILIGGGISVPGWLTVLCNAWLSFALQSTE